MSSYTHYTLKERICLQELLSEGKSFREIASILGRNVSSVSREVKRNASKHPKKPSDNKFKYHAWRANICSVVRRRKQQRRAIPDDSEIYHYVLDRLHQFWSPEQIAARWRMEHAGATLSTATIYRYIKHGFLENISAQTHLRRRGKNYNYVHHNSSAVQPEHLIPQWPQAIVKRIRIGDWEGDTVYGGVGKGLLVTLVDRKSKFLCAGLLSSRDSEEVRSAIYRLLAPLPVKSISLDNGSEFAKHKLIESDLHTTVYFAEPHKPWQRGTNENTNDILRFFFPKGFDFRSIDDPALQAIVCSINNRPRKCLGWKSPAEVFSVALA